MQISENKLRSLVRSAIARLDERQVKDFRPAVFYSNIDVKSSQFGPGISASRKQELKAKIENQSQKTINYIKNSLKLTNRVEDKLVYSAEIGLDRKVTSGKTGAFVQGLTKEDFDFYEQNKKAVQSAYNDILKVGISEKLSGPAEGFSSDQIVGLINYVGQSSDLIPSADPDVVTVARKILYKNLVTLYAECCDITQAPRQQRRQYKKDFMKDNQQLIKNFTGTHVMGFGYAGSARSGLLGKIVSFIKNRNPNDEESVWVVLKEPVKPVKLINVQQPSFEFSGPITGIFNTGDAQTERRDSGGGNMAMSRAGGQKVDDIQAGSRFVKHAGVGQLDKTSTSKTSPGEWDELRGYYETLKSGDSYYVEGTMVGKVKAIILNETQVDILVSDYETGIATASRGILLEDNPKLQLVFELNERIRKDKIVFKNLMLEQIPPPFPNVTSEAEILKGSESVKNLPPKPNVPFDLNRPTRAITGQVHTALMKGKITLEDSFEKYGQPGTLDQQLRRAAGIWNRLNSYDATWFVESRDSAGNLSWFNVMNDQNFRNLIQWYNAELQGFKS